MTTMSVVMFTAARSAASRGRGSHKQIVRAGPQVVAVLLYVADRDGHEGIWQHTAQCPTVEFGPLKRDHGVVRSFP